MTSKFTTKPLYGGAITANLPSDLIDASDLRQIPDHQEVFLRPNTLTSIIFEINEYQTASDIPDLDESRTVTNAGVTNIAAGTTSVPTSNAAAASYHLNDTIVPPDYIAADGGHGGGIETTNVTLSKPSLASFPAYLSATTIITPSIDRSAPSTLPQDWQASPAQKESATKTQQLLVRVKEHGVDLCVRVNVPLKEFGAPQSEGALTEIAGADRIMGEVLGSLDVRDFGLFGGGG